MPMRVGVLTTHPIQYQVPWFRMLAAQPGIDLEVLFCMLPDAAQQGEGFGVGFEWDVPLLDGYRYRVLANVARQPSLTRFAGCDTPEVYRIVREETWDTFIVNGWVAKSCLQLLAACRRYSVPCLVRGESNALRPRTAWKRWLQRTLLRQYHAFLSIGQANRAFYHTHGISNERIFDTPYCVDNDRFSREANRLQPERKQLQAEFELNPNQFTFLYCGKFTAKKRPMDLLLALQQLYRNGHRDIQLLMAGDGELRLECEGFVQQAGLPVRFAGFLNQRAIVRAYVAADCLVLPSDHGETWGLVVNEAMACGLPAVVSDQVGCHPDLIVSGETGEVFHMGNVHALAEQMAAVATKPEQVRVMGQAAQRRVNRIYSYEQVLQGIRQALEHVKAH